MHWQMPKETSSPFYRVDGEWHGGSRAKPIPDNSLAGSILAAPTTTYIGRQKCLLLNCVFFLAGAALMTASTTLPMCKSNSNQAVD
jgi:hypothetical protein